VAPYEPHILRRWEQGCRNGREVWREIQAQGYVGAYQLPRAGAGRRGPLGMARIMAYFRRRQRRGHTSPLVPSGLTPRHAVGLVLMRPDDRSAEEDQIIEQLKALDTDVRQAVALLERFLGVARDGPYEHPREQLDP